MRQLLLYYHFKSLLSSLEAEKSNALQAINSRLLIIYYHFLHPCSFPGKIILLITQHMPWTYLNKYNMAEYYFNWVKTKINFTWTIFYRCFLTHNCLHLSRSSRASEKYLYILYKGAGIFYNGCVMMKYLPTYLNMIIGRTPKSSKSRKRRSI